MSLTAAQFAVFKTALLAELDPELVGYRTTRNDYDAANWYNRTAAPAFIIWREDVSASEIGNAWVGTDIDSMSSLNMQRLQLMLASSDGNVFDMTRADRRAGFENPFGSTVSNPSRVAMRAVWQRGVNRVERLFVSGTGTAASPGVAGYIGTVSQGDITRALGF